MPLLPGALECVQRGIFSSLQPANLRLKRAVSNEGAALSHPAYPLLFDPQTAGGLLASVPKDQVARCVAALRAGAELPAGSTVVTVLCDGGARYLSRFWNRDFVEKRGLSWPPGDSGALAGLVERLVAREEDSVV